MTILRAYIIEASNESMAQTARELVARRKNDETKVMISTYTQEGSNRSAVVLYDCAHDTRSLTIKSIGELVETQNGPHVPWTASVANAQPNFAIIQAG